MSSRRSKVVLYVLLVLAAIASALCVLVVLAVASAFDTDRDLSDFESQDEARAFTSAHLPAPLPSNAVIESLHYDQWTDWILRARVRLPSSEAVAGYLDETRRVRTLSDEYCSPHEPPDGARYFLTSVKACGSVSSPSAQILEVHCNTR